MGGRFVLPDRPFTMGTRVFHTYPRGGVPLKLDPRGMGGRDQSAPTQIPPPLLPPTPPLNIQPVLTLCTPGNYDGNSKLRLSLGINTHSLRDPASLSPTTHPPPPNPRPSALMSGRFDTHLPSPPPIPKEDSAGQGFRGSELDWKKKTKTPSLGSAVGKGVHPRTPHPSSGHLLHLGVGREGKSESRSLRFWVRSGFALQGTCKTSPPPHS